METYVYQFLENIRPWFWQGDFNFLWLYLVALFILLHFLMKLKEKYDNYHTFRDERVHKHRASMQEVWSKRQEELSTILQAESIKKGSEKGNEEKKEEKGEKEKEEEEEEKKEEKKGKKGEKKEKKETKEDKNEVIDEKDEKLARLKRKAEYFSGSGGPSGYKPSLQDRYPQVYKRKGGG